MNSRLIIRSYLRERMRAALASGLAVLILFLIAGLYGYGESVRNMSYALLLIFFFGGCLAAFDLIRYYKKCRRLEAALQARESPGEQLPKAKSLPESLYQALVRTQEEEKRGLVTEYDEKRRDMADYYTMWIHQIKTPIAAMRLLLQDEAQGREVQGKGEREAAEELFKIEQYAEMALHYARLDSLSSDLLFKQQEVFKIVKKALKKYGILFIGSKLFFSMEEFSCMAVTDEKWLCFVVEQLLSNALKYTREGGISIYGADARGERMAGRVSFLVIEDTGIGIREADLPRIFERGFTGYNGRLDQKSTGIGLYLCRQIMDRLSHSIRVESAEGKGTKVILGFEQEGFGDM